MATLDPEDYLRRTLARALRELAGLAFLAREPARQLCGRME
jgi:hypothetical protein